MNGSGEMTMINEELFKKVIKKYGLDNISEEEQKKFVEELNEIEKDIDKIRSMSFKYDKDEKNIGRFLGA
jgi:Asp-tRNA(Asn)/Glu-tRNA(Gln) amidotransferase C subunit